MYNQGGVLQDVLGVGVALKKKTPTPTPGQNLDSGGLRLRLRLHIPDPSKNILSCLHFVAPEAAGRGICGPKDVNCWVGRCRMLLCKPHLLFLVALEISLSTADLCHRCGGANFVR